MRDWKEEISFFETPLGIAGIVGSLIVVIVIIILIKNIKKKTRYELPLHESSARGANAHEVDSVNVYARANKERPKAT